MSQLKKGLEAFHNQNYPQALIDLKPLAEQGNTEAQCILGNLYHLGLGVNQNSLEAVKWYRQSAQQGDPIAANNLGTIYLTGDQNIEQDITEAQYWLQQARQQGFGAAPSDSDYLLSLV